MATDKREAQLAEARAEAERLTDRLTEQVANGDGWRTGQAAAENRCHALSTSLTEARALFDAARATRDKARTELAEARALLRECQPWMPASRGCEASRKLDEYMRANPESPRAAECRCDLGAVNCEQHRLGAVSPSAPNLCWKCGARKPTNFAREDGCSDCGAPGRPESPRAQPATKVVDGCKACKRNRCDCYERDCDKCHWPGSPDCCHAVLALRAVK